MRESPFGAHAAIIGTVTANHPGMLAARTAIGGTLIIPLQIGEQILRIC
jgi:hydrogenase expression/formation protein HypE